MMARLVIHITSRDLDALPARLDKFAADVRRLLECRTVQAVRRHARRRIALCAFCQSVQGNPAVDEEYACRQCGPLPVVEGLQSLRIQLGELPNA